MSLPDAQIPSWPRPDFEPSGRSAELFYLVVGPAPAQPLRLTRKRYHLDRLEPGLQVQTLDRAADPATFDGFLNSPLGAEIDMLFLEPDEVRAAARMTVIRGSFADPPDLDYLRNAIGLVSAAADTPGALAIFDAHALMWWRLSDWHAAFIDNASFRIADHVGIVVTDRSELHPGFWTHTRGMTKFGRPELHLKHIPGAYSSSNPAINASTNILRGMARYLAQGAALRDGQIMNLPSFDSTVTFVETPDDSATTRYFNNAALEICDFDRASSLPVSGAPHLLEQAIVRLQSDDHR